MRQTILIEIINNIGSDMLRNRVKVCFKSHGETWNTKSMDPNGDMRSKCKRCGYWIKVGENVKRKAKFIREAKENNRKEIYLSKYLPWLF